MAQQDSSQSQKDHPWSKLFDEQLIRVASFYDELGRLEQQGVERATGAIDEMARLGKETLSYSSKLSAEWRRLGLEATRRAAGLVTSSVES